MKRSLCIVLLILMVAVSMIPVAFADVVYKSSYIVAGYPGGCGGYQAGGSAYGTYGGVILGNLKDGDIKTLSVIGEYDSDSNEYVIHYSMELNFDPSIVEYGDGIMFYIPVQSPIGGGVSLYCTSTAYKNKPIRDALLSTDYSYINLVRFDDKRLMASFSGTPVIYYTDTNCQAVPVTLVEFHGQYCDIWIRVSDPAATVTITGHESFLDTIMYPFNIVAENSFVVTFVANIFTAPLIKPFFTLVVSALAIGLIVKFMR